MPTTSTSCLCGGSAQIKKPSAWPCSSPTRATRNGAGWVCWFWPRIANGRVISKNSNTMLLIDGTKQTDFSDMISAFLLAGIVFPERRFQQQEHRGAARGASRMGFVASNPPFPERRRAALTQCLTSSSAQSCASRQPELSGGSGEVQDGPAASSASGNRWPLTALNHSAR